ncbi:hypothetical protein GCM10009557_23180 [Virgisporangium ochraceum]|uniref:Uncharacterized protein n=1 Tax=Virgisporangium ochraceum TaxID=65505 RepID=A0A8J4A6I5_9ACTN|nr:hypothetical protein [Virgisporangium ochraceum]GIJ75113.1 hypothetical protein Voc01_100300 [Virgisporangium ochraceum]
MVTPVVPAVRSATPRGGVAAAPWNRVAAAHRRTGRVEWIVLVVVMLLPQMVTVLLVTR